MTHLNLSSISLVYPKWSLTQGFQAKEAVGMATVTMETPLNKPIHAEAKRMAAVALKISGDAAARTHLPKAVERDAMTSFTTAEPTIYRCQYRLLGRLICVGACCIHPSCYVNIGGYINIVNFNKINRRRGSG